MLTDIVNHLWQSTLFVLVVASLVALLRNNGAHVRYWLWWAASVKFLVPFSLLTLLGNSIGAVLWDAGGVPLNPMQWRTTLQVLEPMRPAVPWTPLALALLAIWLLGCAGLLGRWAVRAQQVRALLRASRPHSAALPQRVDGLAVRATTSLLEPVLVGILRPTLLMPHDIADRLTPAQLGAVVAHELAHWRRRDNLTAVVHLLVEAFFWFHPLVWWLGARLVDERERACDEAVVRAGHDGLTYAEGILNVCEHYVASTLKCAAGITGADLKRRVVEITRSKAMSDLPMSKRFVLGTFALAAVLVPVAFGIAQGDGDLRPIVRIAPEYPPALLAAKLEGEVNLLFTITAAGAVSDIVVIESTAPEFEEPAIAALMKWRYLPTNLECVGTVCTPIANAVAVERPGVRTTIRFQLDGPGVPRR